MALIAEGADNAIPGVRLDPFNMAAAGVEVPLDDPLVIVVKVVAPSQGLCGAASGRPPTAALVLRSGVRHVAGCRIRAIAPVGGPFLIEGGHPEIHDATFDGDLAVAVT
ncbi:MAG: hypothetical protein ABSA16_14645 [Thermoguttaceae bacterium]